MNTILLKSTSISCRLLVVSGILLAFFCFSGVVSAQQPTATIESVDGQVLVSIQGKAPVVGAKGTILQTGDIIETKAGAQAVLILSEGSELQLGQNTKIDITTLTQRPKTKARTSRLKLLYGEIRAILSPGHQEKGSAFTVDTPNATAGVKFSQPDIEIMYRPNTKTTIIIGHTVAITVTKLLTKEIKKMPPAHQAIVQDEFLWIAPFIPGTEEIPSDWKRRHTRDRFFMQSRRIVCGTVSTVPVSVGARAETSQSPGPGTSAIGPRPQTVTVHMTEEE